MSGDYDPTRENENTALDSALDNDDDADATTAPGTPVHPVHPMPHQHHVQVPHQHKITLMKSMN